MMLQAQIQPLTYRLIATVRDVASQNQQITPGRSLFVGSSSNCGFRLTGPGLSDIHCHISNDGGTLFVKDWMSASGTQINGQTISDQTELRPDDVVQIGDYRIAIEAVQEVVSEQAAAVAEPVSTEDPQPLACQDPAEHQESFQTDASQTFEPEPAHGRLDSAEPMGLEDDFFDFEEEETYDRETVALLHAEIEDLQSALAQRDAQRGCERCEARRDDEPEDPLIGGTDQVLQRMQELIDEANRSDERVTLLEELLQIAEEANRSREEEQKQLEAWVSDIENRIGKREDEHAAELEMLRTRLEEATDQQQKLQQKLRQAAQGGTAPKHYEETLENLQQSHRDLQESLARSQKERAALEKRLEQMSTDQESGLREERALIAQEQAKLSRMR